jgi:uncharacterized membrane protein YkvI
MERGTWAAIILVIGVVCSGLGVLRFLATNGGITPILVFGIVLVPLALWIRPGRPAPTLPRRPDDKS